MKNTSKIIFIGGSLLFSFILCLTMVRPVYNWRLSHQVRSAFDLKEPKISADEIQAFLANKFPPGTPREKVEGFLFTHFGKGDRPIMSNSQNTLWFQFSFSCPDLLTNDFMLLSFVFAPDSNKLEAASVHGPFRFSK